jgi:hypothetical protein
MHTITITISLSLEQQDLQKKIIGHKMYNSFLPITLSQNIILHVNTLRADLGDFRHYVSSMAGG